MAEVFCQRGLVVEGIHDVSLFEDALVAAAPDFEIQVKPLGGAPENVDGLIAAVLQAGGLNPNQRTYFLFDNDKNGRAAYNRLSNHQFHHQRREFGQGKFVRCLPFTNDFNNFLDRYGISKKQAFFTAEFLFDIEESANLCSELIAGREGEHDFDDWLNNINGQYFGVIGQRPYLRLATAARGTSDWLYARGVPGILKGQFAVQVVERDIQSPLVTEIANDIIAALR